MKSSKVHVRGYRVDLLREVTWQRNWPQRWRKSFSFVSLQCWWHTLVSKAKGYITCMYVIVFLDGIGELHVYLREKGAMSPILIQAHHTRV